MRDLLDRVNYMLEDAEDQVALDALIREKDAEQARQTDGVTEAQPEGEDGEEAAPEEKSQAQTTAKQVDVEEEEGAETLDYEAGEMEPPFISTSSSVHARAETEQPTDDARRSVLRRNRALHSHNIPVSMARADLIAGLSKVTGFRRVALSAPTDCSGVVRRGEAFACARGLQSFMYTHMWGMCAVYEHAFV